MYISAKSRVYNGTQCSSSTHPPFRQALNEHLLRARNSVRCWRRSKQAAAFWLTWRFCSNPERRTINKGKNHIVVSATIKISQSHVTVSLGRGCKSSLKKWAFRVGLKGEQRWPRDDLGLSRLEGGRIGQSCKVGERGGMSLMGKRNRRKERVGPGEQGAVSKDGQEFVQQ